MRIVTRDRWGARAPKAQTPRSVNQILGVCYHHTAGPTPSPWRSGPSILREIQTYHMDSRDCSDIAYNAIIGPGGKIYEGRPITVMGAHSDGEYKGASANRVLLGICFLGNYEQSELSEKSKASALALEYLWALKLGRPLDYVTHRETKPTACPGGDVQRWIDGRR